MISFFVKLKKRKWKLSWLESMAILLRNGFLQIIIIFMLTLPFFTEAQIHYYNTAQAPTSWTNNNLSMPSISGSNRIILLNKIGFACGFYSDSADNYYFAVGLAKTWKGWSPGEGNWYLDHVTWSANRGKPVGMNATLQLTSDGNLILRDEYGVLVWSTNTSNVSVAGIKMMETGNLVLYNHINQTVWQSFDYPTDTLLPGQKLIVGKNLVASMSRTNRSEGRFVLSVTSQGLFAFYQADHAPQLYYKKDPFFNLSSVQLYHDNDTTGILLMRLRFASSSGYYFTPGFESSVRYSLTSYMKFDSDGHLRLYDDYIDQPVDFMAINECAYPTSCGNYGLCTYGQCICLPGFARDNSVDGWGRYGCKELNPTTCEKPQSHTFLVIEDVHYFTYIDPEAATLKDTDAEGCKEACLKNCSCKAALFHRHDVSSLGNCYLPSPVLSFIDGKGRSDFPNYFPSYMQLKSYAFIKVRSQRKSGRKHTEMVIGSSIGALLLVSLIAGLWIVILRRKREGDSGMEDDLYQLPGSPVRFTYEELKSATGDFQKRLGKGGFGSVFEGTLENGEGIAVKCLESLRQGKKEFLAEVRTVGSIHHVNLVRLIGFCAQKQQRLLVYELVQNGSLDRWIFRKNPLQHLLDWRTRRQIILDVAKGLAYLHQDCRQRIVHLDIKPQNILLDENLHAKISDFGLSKLIDRDQSQVMTTMRGTPGYLAPEWFNSIVTEKADVYSFGIVVMEVLCGRKNLDKSQPEELMHLLPIFMRKAEESRLTDMVDEFSEDMQLHRLEAAETMKAAVWCLQSDFTRRPTMHSVVSVLEGKMDVGADLDFSIHNPTTMVARRSEADPGETSPLLPSILSGPR